MTRQTIHVKRVQKVQCVHQAQTWRQSRWLTMDTEKTNTQLIFIAVQLIRVARALRSERPDCKIILSEPHNATLLGSGLPQERNEDDSPKGSHPAWEPHVIQGWTPDFIPKVLQEGIDSAFFDEVRPVDGMKGMAMAQHLAANEGILTGVSGGSTLTTAVEVAETAPEGSVILVMLPDTGERYLSTPLFEAIPAEMSEEEAALFASTR